MKRNIITILLTITCFMKTSHACAQGSATVQVQRCVQQRQRMVNIEVDYDTEKGTYSVMKDGKRMSLEDAYPADSTYALEQSWYLNGEDLQIGKERYEIYGLSRVLGADEVGYKATFKGVPVYVQTWPPGDNSDMVYVALRPGCEFQPYARRRD